MPEPSRSDDHEPTRPHEAGSEPATQHAGASEEAPTSVRDRWWWSPALSIVVGLVVAGYQWGPLTGPDGIVLNWVVAAIGVGLAIAGVVRLARAYPR